MTIIGMASIVLGIFLFGFIAVAIIHFLTQEEK